MVAVCEWCASELLGLGECSLIGLLRIHTGMLRAGLRACGRNINEIAAEASGWGGWSDEMGICMGTDGLPVQHSTGVYRAFTRSEYIPG